MATAPNEESDEPPRKLFFWAEFMVGGPFKPKRRNYKAKALSLFGWAAKREREAVPAEALR